MSPNSLRLILTTMPLVHINCLTRHILPPATSFVCIEDCCSHIFQAEYQGQTRNTTILERNPLINT